MSELCRDSLGELAAPWGRVMEGFSGCMARSGAFLGQGESLSLGVAGGVQKRLWSFEAPALARREDSQLTPSGWQPKSDSSQ